MAGEVEEVVFISKVFVPRDTQLRIHGYRYAWWLEVIYLTKSELLYGIHAPYIEMHAMEFLYEDKEVGAKTIFAN